MKLAEAKALAEQSTGTKLPPESQVLFGLAAGVRSQHAKVAAVAKDNKDDLTHPIHDEHKIHTQKLADVNDAVSKHVSGMLDIKDKKDKAEVEKSNADADANVAMTNATVNQMKTQTKVAGMITPDKITDKNAHLILHPPVAAAPEPGGDLGKAKATAKNISPKPPK